MFGFSHLQRSMGPIIMRFFYFKYDILGMIDKGEEDTGEITNVYTANWEICK